MATTKLLRGIVTLTIVVWIKVSANREINCNGRDFECDGAFTYITCIYLPDGEKLYLPTRCKPGTACNSNNTAEEPCDLDSARNTTLSTASTSTADVPTTVGEPSTLPYVRATRQPDYVLSERLSEIDTVNETIRSALQGRKDSETDVISVSHSVNVTNTKKSRSNSSANVTTLTSIEPPAKVKTSSIITFDRNDTESINRGVGTVDARPAFVETNTTVQKNANISGSSQLFVSTFTKAFFQFSKIQTQNVITFSNTQIGNSNGSTVSINVATGVSPGTGYSDDFSVTTNTTVYFGSTNDEPMMDLKMPKVNDQPGIIVFKNNETGKTDMIVTHMVNTLNKFENNHSERNNVNLASNKEDPQLSNDHHLLQYNSISSTNLTQTGDKIKIPESIHALWQHSPIFTNSEDSHPTTISLNWTNASESILDYDDRDPMVNSPDFAITDIKDQSKPSNKDHLNGFTTHDLAVQEDEGTLAKRHSTGGDHQTILEDDLDHAIEALIAATNKSLIEDYKRTTLMAVAELILHGRTTELPGDRTIQHINETSMNSMVNQTVEVNGGPESKNTNLPADTSREGRMYQTDNITVSDSIQNPSAKEDFVDKNGSTDPVEYIKHDTTTETSTVETTILPTMVADIASVETTTIQIETFFESYPITADTILFTDTNSEATGSETTELPTTDIVPVTETIVTSTTADLLEISTKLQEDSTISPNWPDLTDMKPHPVVSETTFEMIHANGGAFNGLSDKDGELGELKLKIENGNLTTTEDTTVSTTTLTPEQYTTEDILLTAEVLTTKSSISDSPNSTVTETKEVLLNTQSSSNTQPTTIILENEPLNVTEKIIESTTIYDTSSLKFFDSTEIPVELYSLVETTLNSLEPLSSIQATTLMPTTTKSEEEYATLFATETPVIISVVTQNKVLEPIDPKVNGSVTSPINLSDNQTALDTNKSSLSTKPRRPFVCAEHGVFPDEDECRQYYLCVQQPSGYVKITGSCKPRYAFDFSIQRCVRDVSSCYAEKCVAEGYYTDPSDSTSYFWCNEVIPGVFHKYHLQCDPPAKFNPNRRICEVSSNQTADNPVGPIQNSQLKDYQSIAKIELRRTENPIVSPSILIETEYRQMTATTNKYETAFIESFPVDDLNLLDDEIGKSTQAKTTPVLVKRSIRSVSDFSNFECSNEGIFAHPMNCSQYFMCVKVESDTYSDILRECPHRYAYHDKIKSCSRDLSVCVNLHSHCRGIGNFPDPSDEKSYYRCVPNASGGLRIYHIKCEGHKRYSWTRNACSEDEALVDQNSVTELNELRKLLVRSASRDDSQMSVASHLYRKDAERKLRLIIEEMRDEAVKQYEANLERMQSGSLAEFKCKEDGRFPDPNNCRMYYICSSGKTDGLMKHHLQCRGSDRFDASKRICVDEEDARCA